MFPFVSVGHERIPTYGLLLCMAILLGVRMAAARAERYSLPKGFVYNAASLAVLVALLGAKLTGWLIHLRTFSPNPSISGSGTFLGGFLLAVLAIRVYTHKAKFSPWSLADSFAPSLALGVSVVRIGCLGASCDYGKPTTLAWAIIFRNPIAARLSGVPLNVPLHPSQIYESVLGLLILGVLLWLGRKPRVPGLMTLVFVSLYSVGRFLLEFLRGDVDRGFWGPLSTSQWLALFTLLVFWVYYLREASGAASQGLKD
jgi:phosphatidylglycerol---prolipoprotein diacylglyceryl transferase